MWNKCASWGLKLFPAKREIRHCEHVVYILKCRSPFNSHYMQVYALKFFRRHLIIRFNKPNLYKNYWFCALLIPFHYSAVFNIKCHFKVHISNHIRPMLRFQPAFNCPGHIFIPNYNLCRCVYLVCTLVTGTFDL